MRLRRENLRLREERELLGRAAAWFSLRGTKRSGKAGTRMAVFEWIEGWYTTRRRHSTLGYQSPNDFEARAVEPS